MDKVKKKLEAVLFPVQLSDIFLGKPGPGQGNLFKEEVQKYEMISHFKAVESTNDGYVFAVVASDYNLIPNKKAIELGQMCFDQVFKLTQSEEMQVFNVIMPSTKSFCHIDYIHPRFEFKPFTDDKWFPYLRITNSYNRMYALNFDLGFCRGICRNGVIFGKRNIEFKYYHSRRETDPQVEFNLRAGEFAALEALFIESLVNLERFHVPRKVMWALACKVFAITIHDLPTKKQQELLEEKKNHIDKLTKGYFDQLGENGYAALNVLTDFASRPVSVISVNSSIDSLQRQAGGWIEDFVSAIEQRNFSFKSYLGDYHQMVA